jgi:hypothetical protein
MRQAFLLTGIMLSCISPAVASPLPPPSPIIYGPPASVPAPRRDRAFVLLRSEIIDLRQVGLAFQASDGGKMTTEHRDYLQARIDAAYQRYHDSHR